MKNRLFPIITLSLTLILLIIPLTSCNSTDNEISEDIVCTDSSIVVEQTILSSSTNPFGVAVNHTTVFPSSTPKIYCTFTLSQDVCCVNIVFNWYSQEEVIGTWHDIGVEADYLQQTLSLEMPEGGFTPGQYSIKLWIDVSEILDISFTII